VPWNPQKVLQKMSDDVAKKASAEVDRPVTPERQVIHLNDLRTPTSSGGLRKMVNQMDITDRMTREFSPLFSKVMKASVAIALSADVLMQDYKDVLETQHAQTTRRKHGLKRVRNDGEAITVGTGRKIDERLVAPPNDAKEKREWEKRSANLYDSYKANKFTETELIAQLPAATTQAKRRKTLL
jgi:hypothetical protein